MGKKQRTRLPTRLLKHNVFGWLMTVDVLEMNMVKIPYTGKVVTMQHLYDDGWDVDDEG